MDKKELKEILESHKKWLMDEGGKRADLRNADLRNADLSDADLRGADLSGADLSGADLSKADLHRADLSGADLRGADLSGADLSDADLHRADLSKADLRNADLSGAELNGAYLRRTDLSGAYLSGADLSGTDLRRADTLSCGIVQVGPIGSRIDYTIYRIDEDIVQCGCWHGAGRKEYKGGTLKEFKARINEVYPASSKDKDALKYRREYLAAIAMFEALRNGD